MNPNLSLSFLPYLAGSLLAGPPLAAIGQTCPDKPIRLVNPFAPGGTTEIIARTIRTELGKNMGQQWILDSKPGDGGNLAMKEVLRSEQVRWSEVLQKANIKPE